jgi:Spy/CpxP family protein refolding chaperone
MASWRKNLFLTTVALLLTFTLSADTFAQPASPNDDRALQGFGGPRGRGEGPAHGGPGGPGGPRVQVGPPGRWWDDPNFAQRLGLSGEQQKKMDDIFNANRLKLIDLFAGVQKEEAIMEPLVAADPPEENKVLAQIDRVAQARAELEKANARMLLEIRRQLTHEQWVKLQAERPPMHRGGPPRGERGGPPRGDGDEPPRRP